MSEEGDDDGINFEEFEEIVIEKINNYFSSNNNALLSYENLEDFLKEIEFDDYCSSEDDKDTLWQSFMKYGKDDKVDAEGIKKGMHEFINFLQNGNEENNDENDENKEIKENKDEQRLTRVSRLIMKNDVNTVNRLVLNKYKQKALEEYDCLDIQTLIQLKRIFSFLNIDENNKNIIPVERIEQIINKHKSINLDKNEVIKYIHYLSCDDKPLEEITTININNTIFSEIDALLEEKLANEDIDIFDISDDDDEGKEDPLDLLDEVLQKLEATKENSLALKEMKNNLAKINKDYTETVNKFLEDNLDENQNENINNIEEMGIGAMEKMEKFDEFINDLTKDQKTSIKKIHSLKKCIMAINKEMNQIKDDYKDIYEKYNNNQELDLNEEMERLYDENTALDEELKAKKEQISELINERAEKDNQINDLYIKLEEAQRDEKDLKKQLSDLKKAAAKNKEEYDNLMDNVLKKMEKKENEEIMERNRIKEMIEKQIQNEEDKKDGEKGQNEKFDFKALNDIDNMNISLTDKLIKKKKILSQLSSDQLMEYVLKLERLNINLKSEKNKKDQKIKELEEKLNQSSKTLTSNKKEIGSLNIEIKKLKNIISNLQNEVKTNEVFRPSKAMNSQIRISRISKLYTEDINARKFNAFKVENKIKNSNDYFKNMAFNINGKKPIKQTKLKDQNINQKLTKEQKTNLAPQNIMNDIYGKDDKNNDDQNKEENEPNPNPQQNNSENNDNKEEPNNKNNFEISKNEENTIEGQKNEYNNSPQNGIEFNFQSGMDIVNEEGEEIVVDNINDINLGGSNKELFEIKEENINENDEKEDNNDNNKPISSFFESKPLENNLENVDEKKEEINMIERETIQVKNNQNEGLEEMLRVQMDDGNNEEEENEDNLGRISEHNSEKKNENQMSKYGMEIGGKKRKKSAHDNNIKSSGDIMASMNSKNILEEVANTIEDTFEINDCDEININNEEPKQNNLEINSNKIQISKTVKEDDLQISNNNVNINSDPKNTKKDNFEISKSGMLEVEDKNNPNASPNKNKIEISSQNSTSINSNPNSKSQIIIQQVSNTNIDAKRTSSRIRREIENNNYDYYSLFHEDYVLRKLNQLNDKANEKNIYSDQIYLLTNGRKLEKRLILLTPSHIFIIEPKEAEFVLTMEKTELAKIAISNQNLNILILLRHKADNIIFLTLRRMDLLNFIKKYYHQSQKPIRFTYEDSFKMRIKGKETQLSVKDKIFTTLSNFDGAIKIGYLQKMSPILFKTFSERLAVLTSIGLIIFNDPTKPPERLYPIIGSKINKALGNKYKRPNCFEILTPNGETKVFAAYKERELNSWLEEFEKVKKDFRNKMKKLDTVNKLEFIDNNNDLFDVQEEDDEEEIIPNKK